MSALCSHHKTPFESSQVCRSAAISYRLHLRSKCWTRGLVRHDRDTETRPEEERGVTPVCTENSDSHSRPIVCLKLQRRAVSGKSNSQSAFGASQWFHAPISIETHTDTRSRHFLCPDTHQKKQKTWHLWIKNVSGSKLCWIKNMMALPCLGLN